MKNFNFLLFSTLLAACVLNSMHQEPTGQEGTRSDEKALGSNIKAPGYAPFVEARAASEKGSGDSLASSQHNPGGERIFSTSSSPLPLLVRPALPLAPPVSSAQGLVSPECTALPASPTRLIKAMGADATEQPHDPDGRKSSSTDSSISLPSPRRDTPVDPSELPDVPKGSIGVAVDASAPLPKSPSRGFPVPIGDYTRNHIPTGAPEVKSLQDKDDLRGVSTAADSGENSRGRTSAGPAQTRGPIIPPLAVPGSPKSSRGHFTIRTVGGVVVVVGLGAMVVKFVRDWWNKRKAEKALEEAFLDLEGEEACSECPV